METVTNEVPKADVPPRDHTIDTKSAPDGKKPQDDCSCEVKPVLVRKDSVESIDEDYRRPHRAGRVLPPFHRRYTPSPHPPHPHPLPFTYQSFMVSSSTQLLDKVGKEDGIVELPAPAIRNVYLTTYPFGDKDVRKWSWLFAAGIEDKFVTQSTHSMTGEVPIVEPVRQRTDEYTPYHDPDKFDIPSVHLSRALDPEVVPEDTKHNVRYLIVTQNRLRPAGAKLIVVESRKAAGILIYYNVLNGDPILFVGATVHQCKTVHPKKYKKVNSLEEAVSVQDDGFVGVVC